MGINVGSRSLKIWYMQLNRRNFICVSSIGEGHTSSMVCLIAIVCLVCKPMYVNAQPLLLWISDISQYFSYFLSLYLLNKETQHDTYLNPYSEFTLNFLDSIYSQMTPIQE